MSNALLYHADGSGRNRTEVRSQHTVVALLDSDTLRIAPRFIFKLVNAQTLGSPTVATSLLVMAGSLSQVRATGAVGAGGEQPGGKSWRRWHFIAGVFLVACRLVMVSGGYTISALGLGLGLVHKVVFSACFIIYPLLTPGTSSGPHEIPRILCYVSLLYYDLLSSWCDIRSCRACHLKRGLVRLLSLLPRHLALY